MLNHAPWRFWGGSKRGILRPIILTLLRNTKLSGTEIMDKVQEMSGGWWRPSPGSIYPLLEDMVRESMLNKNKDGKYEINSKHRESVESPFFGSVFGAPATSIHDALVEIESYVSYMEDLSRNGKKEFVKNRKRITEIIKRLSALIE